MYRVVHSPLGQKSMLHYGRTDARVCVPPICLAGNRSKLALQSLEAALIALRSGAGGSPKEEVLKSMGDVFRLREAAALLVQARKKCWGRHGRR